MLEKVKKYFNTVMFLVIIFSICIANIFVPDRDFSDMENRVLQTLPTFSWEDLIDGKFTADFEDYVSDQTVLKDEWVKLKTTFNLLILNKSQNGVTLDGDKYYQDFVYNEKYFDTNIEHINKFIEGQKIPVKFFAIPTSDGIYNGSAQKDLLTKIDNLTIYNALNEHKNEYIYYKTDHHWTTLGAKYAYEAITGTRVDIEPEKVSDSFLGTLYSKAPTFFSTYDEMYKYDYDQYLKTLKIEDTNKYSKTFFFEDLLETKDKYSYYIGGNNASVNIKTNSESGKKVLIFKDSYTHSMIPFFAKDYSEIQVLDLRYLNIDLKSYIEKGNFDEIYMIYNIDFLNTDVNFYKLNK